MLVLALGVVLWLAGHWHFAYKYRRYKHPLAAELLGCLRGFGSLAARSARFLGASASERPRQSAAAIRRAGRFLQPAAISATFAAICATSAPAPCGECQSSVGDPPAAVALAGTSPWRPLAERCESIATV